jgi:hypothetical protein
VRYVFDFVNGFIGVAFNGCIGVSSHNGCLKPVAAVSSSISRCHEIQRRLPNNRPKFTPHCRSSDQAFKSSETAGGRSLGLRRRDVQRIYRKRISEEDKPCRSQAGRSETEVYSGLIRLHILHHAAQEFVLA